MTTEKRREKGRYGSSLGTARHTQRLPAAPAAPTYVPLPDIPHPITSSCTTSSAHFASSPALSLSDCSAPGARTGIWLTLLSTRLESTDPRSNGGHAPLALPCTTRIPAATFALATSLYDAAIIPNQYNGIEAQNPEQPNVMICKQPLTEMHPLSGGSRSLSSPEGKNRGSESHFHTTTIPDSSSTISSSSPVHSIRPALCDNKPTAEMAHQATLSTLASWIVVQLNNGLSSLYISITPPSFACFKNSHFDNSLGLKYQIRTA
ncbi:hypothetical protein M422DRAFT_46956 [Sphaerobolus stellatus SS14]|uniref:Uncharacterized protein n=1 Tax=Sphaerobolus stellatus (strain SS14) TaxID=990650 RepID=A0A0C9W101_SPHS4|nr:hypothetical protein M422DRAFT_46956 [Sphaerobolus stellatus SS14]